MFDIDFSEEIFESKHSMAMCQMDEVYHTDYINLKGVPRTQDQAYWYYLGMHDECVEIYLKLKQRNEK